MNSIRLRIFISTAVFLGVAWGIFSAVRSDRFRVAKLEIDPPSHHYPVNFETIGQIAERYVQGQSLFSLSLEPLKQELLRNPWVKGVVVQKEFPDTLRVRIIERNPVAWWNTPEGVRLWVEESGELFRDGGIPYPFLLPQIQMQGASVDDMVGFLRFWNTQAQLKNLQITDFSVNESDYGVEVRIRSPLRVSLLLGPNLAEAKKLAVGRLVKTLAYLAEKRLNPLRIWASDGKKIIVKLSVSP